jgi:DNA-binding CsgD family transcriptional regulator
MEKLKVHSESFQVFVGCAGAALQVGLAITDYIEPDDVSFGPVYAAFALILLASARYAFLGPAQAVLFFAVCGLQTADTLNPFYGLGFAAIAVLVLFRRGNFSTRGTIKAAGASAVGISLFAIPILLLGKGGMAWLPVSICAAIYTALVFGLARSGELSSLVPKKRVLRLAEYKLLPREIRIVKARLGGRSVKELASDFGLAESTIRNALSFSYRKLNIDGAEDLMTLGERYRVE